MESISVFEIIKVGIGPSSSHTMGPWRAASFFLEYLKKREKITEVVSITTYLFGSLAKTGWGHGTDVAVLMGLSQEDYLTIDTTAIRQKADNIIQSGRITIDKHKTIDFNYKDHMVFDFDQSLDFHPNGMRFVAELSDGTSITREYFSVGGGFVVTHDSDHVAQNPIVTQYPCHSAQDIESYCEELNLSISQLVMMNEMAWRNEEETRSEALTIWSEIKKCIFRGISKRGILPGGLGVHRRAADMVKKLMPGQTFLTVEDLIKAIRLGSHDFNTVNKWVSTFALAVNEENADFGRIITAPTNGASGVIPAVLMYAYCFTPHFGEEEIIKFILTAGEIGTLYKKGATISAAMGGCQAEIGVSSSMAAGGLTEAFGGSRAQVLQAAEIAMEHHLGMTCDPIGGLVQIPCIERNCMGAIKAITASNIAMGLDIPTALVSLDNVIKTMWETALDMNTKYKETSEGGLANISVNISEC
ncbi:L-serine ammonia-lyase [Membranihabitans marinus]|uniref:L-serine ammonia-lyase n=1 Tax=Membranihabitans marinus TaxID=1227546 RepID=UPI001F02D56B|nr:L-serine ammonia-lyase [Membranihabitans marinus]